MNKPKNSNYAALVVEIKTLLPLATCDNVVGAQILGNQVIVGKDVKVGDIGLYFPLECQLSAEYLKANNLYKHTEMNADITKKGYFDDNGRIRCVKFRGHKSEGLYMPLTSLDDINFSAGRLSIGDEFDELNGIPICCKYIVKQRISGMPGSRQQKKPKISKLIDNQFRFHDETSMLYKNLHKINPDDLIQISYKMHGTSGISSRILCKKNLSWYNKFLKWVGLDIVDTEYDNIYASRKVIKNEELNPQAQHYYDVDIWGLANNKVKEFLVDGMTLYYEVIGYLPSNAMIQKDYDYGQEPGTFGIYIYRITMTNVTGKVFEFSAKQVQDWCKSKGLNPVPQLYYGFVKGLVQYPSKYNSNETIEEWRNSFLEYMKTTFNEHECFMCKTVVPEEGAVIRIEKNDFEAYKCKSNAFFARETALLDKGESDIESEN